MEKLFSVLIMFKEAVMVATDGININFIQQTTLT